MFKRLAKEFINLAPFFLHESMGFSIWSGGKSCFSGVGAYGQTYPLPSCQFTVKEKQFHWSEHWWNCPTMALENSIKDGIIGVFFFDCRCSDTTLCSFKTSCRIVIRFDTWRDDTQRLKDTWGWKVIQVSISTKLSNNGIMLKFWVIRYPSCVGWLGRGFPVNPPDICRFRVAKTRSSTMCSYRGWRVSAPVA